MGQYEKITLEVEGIEIEPSSSRKVEITLTCDMKRLCNELVETEGFFATMHDIGFTLEDALEPAREIEDFDNDEIIDYLESIGYKVEREF